MKYALVAAVLLSSVHTAYADEKCDALVPSKAQGVSEEFNGKLEGEAQGILSRLAGGKANLSGYYKKTIADALGSYPAADKLYVWDRVLYLACIQPERSIDINKLFDLYLRDNRSSVGANKYALSPKSVSKTYIRGNRVIYTYIDRGNGNYIINQRLSN